MKLDKSENKWDRYGEVRLLSRNRLLFERHRLLTRYFLDFFKDADTSFKILDIGCGDGFFLELLRDLGFKNIFGIDLSNPMISHARKKGLRVEKRDIYDLDNKDDYDVILLMDILEHLNRPYVGLNKVYSALKSDGILFLNIPVCDSVQKRARRLFYSETRASQMKDWDETHIGSYSKKEVINILEETGFKMWKVQRLSNTVPIIGRFSEKISKFLQYFTLFGIFGDFLTIVAKKERI